MRYCFVCLLLVIVSFGRVDAQENRNGFRLDTIYKSGAKQPSGESSHEKKCTLEIVRVPESGKMDIRRCLRGILQGDYTSIEVSPQIGYRWNEFFSAGEG